MDVVAIFSDACGFPTHNKQNTFKLLLKITATVIEFLWLNYDQKNQFEEPVYMLKEDADKTVVCLFTFVAYGLGLILIFYSNILFFLMSSSTMQNGTQKKNEYYLYKKESKYFHTFD